MNFTGLCPMPHPRVVWSPCMKLSRVLFILLFTAIIAPFSAAQISANVQGRVVDTSGAVIQNAPVELTQTSTNVRQTTTTSGSGDFLFTHLNPGVYQLAVTVPGFQHLVRTG